MLQDFAVVDDLASGELVALLPEYSYPVLPIYVIYPEKEHIAPKIRAMIDFLQECFQANGVLR